MGRQVSDSELAKAIESSPFHQLMVGDDISTARYGREYEEIAADMGELLGDTLDDDEAPTVVISEAERRWYRS